YTRQAGLASMDYQFPLWNIFRGWGTNPIFAEQLSGFVFGESVVFPTRKGGGRFLPSAGGGIELKLEAFNRIPISVSTEYHRGFREQDGGMGEVFLRLGLQGLSF